MEKFALLDILKAFERLAPKPNSEPAPSADVNPAAAPAYANGNNAANTNPAATQKPTAAVGGAASMLPEGYPVNVMANVLARHEEISNRIRNKR